MIASHMTLFKRVWVLYFKFRTYCYVSLYILQTQWTVALDRLNIPPQGDWDISSLVSSLKEMIIRLNLVLLYKNNTHIFEQL